MQLSIAKDCDMSAANLKIKFSLVTTCRNEMRSFERWKLNILEQTRRPDEIVIVDAFSDDGTTEALLAWTKEDNRIKVIQEKGHVAHGRNVAIKNASFDHIVSTDMGVRLASEWFAELTAPFEKDETIELVIGNTCIDTKTLKSAAARAEYYQENGGFGNPGPGVVGGNRSSAYLRRLWKECGGLPEDLSFAGDDSTFFRQLNAHQYKTAYAPKAMTYWGRPSTLKQFWKEAWVYGRGDGEAWIKEPWAFKMYRMHKMPWLAAAIINGLRITQKKCSCEAYWRALKKGDWNATMIMPVLAFGIGWRGITGYKVGYERGNTQCLECRKRLSSNVR